MTAAPTLWWAYLHQNGTVQVKRWFGDHADYTDDCYGNPFVLSVVPPFPAATRKMADATAHERLKVVSTTGERA